LLLLLCFALRTQVYYGLRAGMHDVALRAAERALDYSQRGAGGSSVKQLLQAWLGNAAGFRANHGARMVQECERLLQGYNQKQVGADRCCFYFSPDGKDATVFPSALLLCCFGCWPPLAGADQLCQPFRMLYWL
jgi:hypothetical protein